MKKVKFNGKLSLNKETITSLNHIQMQEINVVRLKVLPAIWEVVVTKLSFVEADLNSLLLFFIK